MGRSGRSTFQFQQFAIEQDRCAMKVGLDGILLGAWTSTISARKILDVGTGTGLIALMLAQRSPLALIQAIEIESEAAIQARENVARSPWKNRIQVHHQSLQALLYKELQREKSPGFDVIVSNPPYFSSGTPSPDSQRSLARQTTDLTLLELLSAANQLLTNSGHLSLILPQSQQHSFLTRVNNLGWHCRRLLKVRPREGIPVKRVLMELTRGITDCTEMELVLEWDRHCYTDDYAELIKPFFLRYSP